MPRSMKNQVRLILDTMVMKAIALAGSGNPNKIAMSAYLKITRRAHVVIISRRLIKQYETKMEEDNIPAEYFLNFLQNTLEANGQLKQVSDDQADKMQVHVKLPSEDVFLAQIAMAADPNQFNVYIISNERGIYRVDAQLNKKHRIRALTTYTYSNEYC